MTPAAAKSGILREFGKLSLVKRESGAERLSFAKQMRDKYQFESNSDPLEIILSWLVNEISDDDW